MKGPTDPIVVTLAGQTVGVFMPVKPWEPVVKVPLHSTDDASHLAALLLRRIFPIFSIVAPCQPGASSVSMRRGTFTTGS